MRLQLKNLKPLLLAISILIPLVVGIYFLQSSLQGLMGREIITPDCDLNEASCEIILDSDRVMTLTMNPVPARSLVPLMFTFKVDGEAPESAWIDLQGTTEYMGINQTPFQLSKGRWEATTELSVCTTGLMVWRARLTLVEFSGRSVPIDLYFEAQ